MKRGVNPDDNEVSISLKKSRSENLNKFLESCRTGNLEHVQFACDSQTISIDDIAYNDFECMRLACTHGHGDVLNYLADLFGEKNVVESELLLISYFESPILQVEEVDDALEYAALKNWMNLLKTILETPDLQIHVSESGITKALYRAIEKGHTNVVEFLIPICFKKGVNLKEILCILLVRATTSGRLSIFELLLSQEWAQNILTIADIDYLLMGAAGKGHVNLVEFMLSEGYPYHPTDSALYTALFDSIRYSRVEVVANLLARHKCRELFNQRFLSSIMPLFLDKLRVELLNCVMAVQPDQMPALTPTVYTQIYNAAVSAGNLPIVRRLQPLMMQWIDPKIHNENEMNVSTLKALGCAANQGNLRVVEACLEMNLLRSIIEEFPLDMVHLYLGQNSVFIEPQSNDAVDKIAAHFPKLREAIEVRNKNKTALLGVCALARNRFLPSNAIATVGQFAAGPQVLPWASFIRVVNEVRTPLVAVMEQQPTQSSNAKKRKLR